MTRSLKSSSIFQTVTLLALVIACACSSNVWDELPDDISTFVSQYYPGQGVAGYSESDDGNRVELSNGATLMFDSDANWTTLDGNGSRLPEVMVYDQLPPALFQYLEEMEDAADVFKVSRTSSTYIVTLENTYITYDVESGAITYPTAPQASSKTASGS